MRRRMLKVDRSVMRSVIKEPSNCIAVESAQRQKVVISKSACTNVLLVSVAITRMVNPTASSRVTTLSMKCTTMKASEDMLPRILYLKQDWICSPVLPAHNKPDPTPIQVHHIFVGARDIYSFSCPRARMAYKGGKSVSADILIFRPSAQMRIQSTVYPRVVKIVKYSSTKNKSQPPYS